MEPAPRGEIDLAGATVGLLPIVRRHPEWTPFFIHTEAESFALAAEILEDAQVWVSMLVACAGSEAHLVAEEVPRAVYKDLQRLYSSDSDLSEAGGTTESWSLVSPGAPPMRVSRRSFDRERGGSRLQAVAREEATLRRPSLTEKAGSLLEQGAKKLGLKAQAGPSGRDDETEVLETMGGVLEGVVRRKQEELDRVSEQLADARTSLSSARALIEVLEEKLEAQGRAHDEQGQALEAAHGRAAALETALAEVKGLLAGSQEAREDLASQVRGLATALSSTQADLKHARAQVEEVEKDAAEKADKIEAVQHAVLRPFWSGSAATPSPPAKGKTLKK